MKIQIGWSRKMALALAMICLGGALAGCAAHRDHDHGGSRRVSRSNTALSGAGASAPGSTVGTVPTRGAQNKAPNQPSRGK